MLLAVHTRVGCFIRSAGSGNVSFVDSEIQASVFLSSDDHWALLFYGSVLSNKEMLLPQFDEVKVEGHRDKFLIACILLQLANAATEQSKLINAFSLGRQYQTPFNIYTRSIFFSRLIGLSTIGLAYAFVSVNFHIWHLMIAKPVPWTQRWISFLGSHQRTGVSRFIAIALTKRRGLLYKGGWGLGLSGHDKLVLVRLLHWLAS
ncbi:hypothetical protein VNO78_24082 [Psophocarpus tetragonolobus]|uniref:Uncharacterized protein n=1 Tax=Psophocarpus tetragonolobus TaxID=3891 RepID=A0AAN9S7W0_PSOTE